jgi:hypothetical protein
MQTRTVDDFRLGNRVMNLNSTLRQFIPFGARGTVIGKTEQQVIVMFDNQILHGSTIYGKCQPYRGAYIKPDYLLNLTQNFAMISKTNHALSKKFQEKPIKGRTPFQDEELKTNHKSKSDNHKHEHHQDKLHHKPLKKFVPKADQPATQQEEEAKTAMRVDSLRNVMEAKEFKPPAESEAKSQDGGIVFKSLGGMQQPVSMPKGRSELSRFFAKPQEE